MADTVPHQSLWAAADLITPMALRVAATLRIADHLGDSGTAVRELSEGTGVDAGRLRRLLRHLCTIDVVTESDDDRFSVTEMGRQLRSDHPSGLRAVLDIEHALGRADLSVVHLLDSVRTGEPGFSKLYGKGFWDDLAADPWRTAEYDARMGRDVAEWAPHIVVAYDWSSLGAVVDVGGGNGTLLVALLEAFPHLRGSVFDQAATAEAARATLAGAGLTHRTRVHDGNFFESVPAGADAYILCAVLHDWDDESAIRVLRTCAAAAGSGGRILVIEKTGAPGEPPPSAMDLRMLAYFGGQERSVADIEELATRAGLSAARSRTVEQISVVELRPEG